MAVQDAQLVVGQLQLPQGGQSQGEPFRQGGDPVPAQVQLLQELQLGEAAVLHQADVVVLQQQHVQLAVVSEGVSADHRDVVVGQVQQLRGVGDFAGGLGELAPGAHGELEVSSTVAARVAGTVRPEGGVHQHQEEQHQLLHDSTAERQDTF